MTHNMHKSNNKSIFYNRGYEDGWEDKINNEVKKSSFKKSLKCNVQALREYAMGYKNGFVQANANDNE